MDDALRKELREQAWSYFDRHAEQRLKTFNFYLLLCGGVIAGVVAASKDHLDGAWPLAFLLSFVSLVFWRLDVRNRQLTKHSEEALKLLEDELPLPDDPGPLPHRCKLFRREEAETSKLTKFPAGEYFSYTTVLHNDFLCVRCWWLGSGNLAVVYMVQSALIGAMPPAWRAFSWRGRMFLGNNLAAISNPIYR